MIEIIPAIDLKGGKCVRLVQGRMDTETVFYDDPVEAARRWHDLGANRLHLVDLEGAVSGTPRNLSSIERIVRAVPIPVQVGGGIRDRERASLYLNLGVDRVVVGTMACREPDHTRQLCEAFPFRIALGLDAREGRVATQGWTETSELRAADLLASFADAPLAGIIYTDIQRDGMLCGPNIPALKALLAVSRHPVIASGGVTSADDIRALARLESMGLAGVIIGRALYAGKITFSQACSAASAGG